MLVLLLVAFISGLLTIFAPCIWPILPIVLSSSVGGGRRRPLGVTLGIIISFFVLTLSLSFLIKVFGFDANTLRLVAIVVIAFLGFTLLFPKLSSVLEGYASRLSGLFGGRLRKGNGFMGGLFAGISLGIVWAPCAGPIFATIAALSATRAVTSQLVLVTFVYMIGTGIPLLIFASFGSHLLTKSRVLSSYTGKVQQLLGIMMIGMSVLIWTGYDRIIEARLLNYFPGYTALIYRLEQMDQVQIELNNLKGQGSLSANRDTQSLSDLGQSPEISGIGTWLNSSPLTMDSLKGKVVLVDFWTYSCINCIRTLPFVTGWYEKYKSDGFVVIGIHTPEFEFEKNTENVQNALRMFHINYPVAQDNNYTTWNNFHNSYWPAKYLIDKNGHLRYRHNGEGQYVETEKAIQSLLAENGKVLPMGTLSVVDQTPQISLTAETYLGKNRADPDSSTVHFTGDWSTVAEYSESKPGSSLELNFFANRVFLVITPSSRDDLVYVFLDGHPVEVGSSGKDVRDGRLILDIPRLYEVINLNGVPGKHILRLDFGSKGTRVYAFTFG